MNGKAVLSGKIEIRFGWDAFPKQYSGGLIAGLRNPSTDIDCDAGALLCGDDGKPISSNANECFLNYAVTNLCDSAILHQGDNQTGLDEDDEIISIDLSKIPETVKSIILTLDILKEKKKIGIGKIQNTFARIINAASGEEIARSDFSHLGAATKLVVAGSILRMENGQWLFEPLAEAYSVKNIDEFIRTVYQKQTLPNCCGIT